MQMKFSKSMAAIFAGSFLAGIASAHPGHAPTDLVAEVSQPLAGPDHLVAFVMLSSILLIAFRLVLNARKEKENRR